MQKSSLVSRKPSLPQYPIASVDNVLRLLLAFRHTAGLRLTDAAEAIGVAPSTAHRLLAMLAHHGFVRQDPATRAYMAGPALIEIGLSAVHLIDIRHHARPALEILAAQTGETVHLAVLEGADVRYLDGIESGAALRVAVRTGATLPAHCTAVGKAMLAELPPDAVRDLYRGQQKLPGLTAQSITTRDALAHELESVRTLGYARNNGESEVGVVSVAVAISEGRGALSVAGPESRLTAALSNITAALRAAVAAVLASLAS